MMERIDPVRVGLLAIYAALAVSSLLGESPTWDEPYHLAQGFRFLKTGDPSFVVEDHPPGVQALAAIPLVLAGRPLDPLTREDPESWTARRAAIGRFLAADGARNLRLLTASKCVIVLLACVLGWFVYSESRRMYGVAAGRLTLALYTLDPNLLAHGRLVTTDLGAAAGTWFVLAALLRWARRPSYGRAFAAGALLGAALLAKHSALSLAAQAPLLLAILVVGSRSRPRFGRLAAHAAAAVVTTVLLVWGVHGFAVGDFDDARPSEPGFLGPRTKAPSPDSPDALSPRAKRPPLGQFLEGRRLPAPDYLFGLRTAVRFAYERERPAYLRGEHSLHGWRSYFPTAFAVKTPIPTLLLVLAAMLSFARVRPTREEGVLSAFIALYFFAAVRGSLNIGFRHLLPILPPLFVLAGRIASPGVADRVFARAAGARRAILAALLVWLAVGTCRTHPHYLAYFNEIAGGPANGWKWLVDASLDWGQDLPGLARWLREHDVERVNLSYFGGVDPGLYGIRWTPIELPFKSGEPVRPEHIPDGTYAISATNLVEFGSLGKGPLTVFQQLEPAVVIGHSIHVYEVRR